MARKKSEDPLQKHTLFLREGDMRALQERFPSQGGSVVVRTLVANFVDKLNAPVTAAELAELEGAIEE